MLRGTTTRLQFHEELPGECNGVSGAVCCHLQPSVTGDRAALSLKISFSGTTYVVFPTIADPRAATR
jgi:hypothetical protein